MIQGSGNQYQGIVDCVQTILREEGPPALLKVCDLHSARLNADLYKHIYKNNFHKTAIIPFRNRYICSLETFI